MKKIEMLEDITEELRGIKGIITALEMAAGEGHIDLSAEICGEYLYGLRAHLERVIKDMGECTEALEVLLDQQTRLDPTATFKD